MQRRSRVVLLAAAISLVGILHVAEAEVQISQQASCVTLHNDRVAVDFDLKKGTYTCRSIAGEVIIQQATLKVNDWLSSASGGVYQAAQRPVTDVLGTGTTLTLTRTSADAPTLLLEITLYESQSFVVLNAGVINTTVAPIQVKILGPIAAVGFAGFDMNEHFSLLDGNSGSDLTRVRHGDELEGKNNFLATFDAKGQNRAMVVGGLTYHDFEKLVSVRKKADGLHFDIRNQDPVGKRVDPGHTYLPDDKIYLNFMTTCPFEALEQYALAVRAAQKAAPDIYDFPTLCLWYSAIPFYGGGAENNHSVGAVWEMDQAVKRGFLKYSRLGIRLVPDNYDPNNQQGWWDDAHWQKIHNVGGNHPCYSPPYETTKKWGQAIVKRGGIPFIYLQTARRSEDYCQAFPGHMLFNQTRREGMAYKWGQERNLPYHGYDFTDPDFLKHMREVYANMRQGGIRGLMFDYPDTGWAWSGGMEDPYSTTAAAYRTIFQLPQEGLEKPNWVHERNLDVGSDITVGVVDSQRTIMDIDRISPYIITTPALRWYKNRVLFSYDTDAKNPFHTFPEGVDGERAMFTMCYVATGRLLLGCSFAKMTDEQLYILSRTLPYHSQPQSARPIDAFVGEEYPRVFDFKVNEQWHQLTLYNTAIEGAKWLVANGNTWTDEWNQLNQKGQPGQPVPATIGVNLTSVPALGGLGLQPNQDYYMYDFWNNRLVGKFKGADKFEQHLRPGEARMLSIHAVEPNPQFLSTNRHIMQGYVDMTKYPQWDPNRRTLSGVSQVAGGETYKVVIAANGHEAVKARANGADATFRTIDQKQGLMELALDSKTNREVPWSITFAK